MKQRLSSTEQFPSGCVEQPGASCYTAAERLRLLPSLENVTLRQTLGWPVKRGGHSLHCENGGASRCHPSPTPPPLHPREQRPRTWWRLEAQDWASAAWALSVSCLSALFSTVTLPSPICLTNRRNYTTVERTKKKQQKKTTKRKKGNDNKDNIDKCQSLSILTETVLLLSETISLENNAANEGSRGNGCVQRNGACSKMTGRFSGKTLSSPLCSAAWGHRLLRRAQWPSASALPRGCTL